MSRPNPFDPEHYATNEQFIAFFAGRGIAVENVRIDPIEHRRRFNVVGLAPMSLDMDTSAGDCLKTVKAFIRERKTKRK